MMLLADWQLTGPLLTLWPFRNDVWREHGQPAQRQLIAFAEQLQSHHPLWFGIHPTQLEAAQRVLPDYIPCLPIAYNDAWARDIGPLWTQHRGTGRLIAHGFQFSAWHGLYPDFRDDQLFAEAFAQRCHVSFKYHAMVLEGGAITTDGAGTAIVHGASILRNNSRWSRPELTHFFAEQLGLQQVFWLDFAHPADETGGHVDNQIQFLTADTLVLSMPRPDGLYVEHYQAQLERAQSWRNCAGQSYRIIQVPQPEPIQPVAAEYVSIQPSKDVFPRGVHPLLASYVNFVRVGDVVVVPTFGIDSDADALAALRNAAPELTVIGVAADEFIKAGGALHCMTLHTPDDIVVS